MLLLIPLTFEKRLFLKRVDRVLTSSTSFLSWLMSILSLIHYTGPHDVRVLSSTFQCQQPSVIFPTARACDAYDGSLALFLVCPIHLLPSQRSTKHFQAPYAYLQPSLGVLGFEGIHRGLAPHLLPSACLWTEAHTIPPRRHLNFLACLGEQGSYAQNHQYSLAGR